MAAITADKVKELREATGAGMMECKKALEENGADMQAATKWLREKGIASATKKAGRAASEGLIGLRVEGKTGAIVELNCETDFVAKTEQFLALLEAATEAGFKHAKSPDIATATAEALQAKGADGQTMEERVKAAIGKLGENMALARVARLNVAQGVLGSYRHGDGKLATLVALECGKAETAAKPEFIELAKDLAMQVAGNLPPAEVVSREQISPELIAREKEIALAQAAQAGAGKPAAILEKIAEGKLNKVLQEITLMDQLFVKDPSLKVAALVTQAAAKLGDTLTISGFARIKVGVK